MYYITNKNIGRVFSTPCPFEACKMLIEQAKFDLYIENDTYYSDEVPLGSPPILMYHYRLMNGNVAIAEEEYDHNDEEEISQDLLLKGLKSLFEEACYKKNIHVINQEELLDDLDISMLSSHLIATKSDYYYC